MFGVTQIFVCEIFIVYLSQKGIEWILFHYFVMPTFKIKALYSSRYHKLDSAIHKQTFNVI